MSDLPLVSTVFQADGVVEQSGSGENHRGSTCPRNAVTQKAEVALNI